MPCQLVPSRTIMVDSSDTLSFSSGLAENSYLTVCEVVSIEPIPEEVEEVEVEVPTAGRPSTSQPSVPQRPSKRHRLHDDMYVDKRSNFLKEKQKVEKGMMKRKEHLRSSKNNRWLPQYITDNSQ